MTTTTEQQMNYEQKIEKRKQELGIVPRPNYILKNYTETPKLCQLVTTEQQRNFKLAMLAVSKGLGIHNVPDKDHLNAVFVFVGKHFGDKITTGEFTYAFELFALGKLDLDKTKHHFQTFNFEFIAAVIQAYIEYRKPTVEKIEREPQTENLLPEHQVPYLEQAKGLHEIVMRYITENRKLPVAMDWQMCYDYLESIGEIQMTVEQKQQFKDYHKQQLVMEAWGKRGTIQEHEFHKLIHNTNDNKYLSWSCRRQCAMNYYELHIDGLHND